MRRSSPRCSKAAPYLSICDENELSTTNQKGNKRSGSDGQHWNACPSEKLTFDPIHWLRD